MFTKGFVPQLITFQEDNASVGAKSLFAIRRHEPLPGWSAWPHL